MEATCTLCNVIDTLYLQKETNIDKGGLLCHWHSLSTKGKQHRSRRAYSAFCCLCHVSILMKEAINLPVKTSKNLYGKREKHIHWVMVVIKPFLQQSYQCHSHPHKKKPRVIPSLFEWVQQWKHWPMCICHQPTKQCQLVNKKIEKGTQKTWNPTLRSQKGIISHDKYLEPHSHMN
jgi:hypothetical protein